MKKEALRGKVYMKKKKTLHIFIKILSLALALILLPAALISCDDGSVPAYRGVDGGGNGHSQKTPVSNNSSSTKRVALTFDDGPHNVYTKNIVDELAKYGAKATFFVVGNRVDGTAYNGSSALQYVAEAGHEIGIHGYTHENYYDSCSDQTMTDELSKTKNAIIGAYPSASVKLMRPVGGKITQERIQRCQYSVIMWSVDSEDWRYKSTAEDVASQNIETIINNVMSSVKDGDIILMHDIYQNTYEATKIILKRLYDEGYEVVTVSDLIGNGISAGQKYSRA